MLKNKQDVKEQIADILPTGSGRAKVNSSGEFSQSTTATTIAFASLIFSFWELASQFGLWMLFSGFTMVIGLLFLKALIPKITHKLSFYGELKPTLFEFLGDTFSSDYIRTIAAIVIIIGYLGVLAVEIVIGSMFINILFPSLSIYLLIGLLAICVVSYTLIGGFRLVIRVDSLLMKIIWLMIISICVFIFYAIYQNTHLSFERIIPSLINDFSIRENLLAALVGLFVLNVSGFIVDLSTWQRISATKNLDVGAGIIKSSIGIITSWSILCLAACLTPLVVGDNPSEVNPLAQLFLSMDSFGMLGKAFFTFGVIGVFAAILSTSSTLLIGVMHAVHADVLKLGNTGINKTRVVTVLITVLAIIAVFLMQAMGFGIVDLVFAVYGSQIGLLPVILIALFATKTISTLSKRIAIMSVSLSFLAGWVVVFLAVYLKRDELIFMSPLINLAVAGVIMAIGFLLPRLPLSKYKRLV